MPWHILVVICQWASLANFFSEFFLGIWHGTFLHIILHGRCFLGNIRWTCRNRMLQSCNILYSQDTYNVILWLNMTIIFRQGNMTMSYSAKNITSNCHIPSQSMTMFVPEYDIPFRDRQTEWSSFSIPRFLPRLFSKNFPFRKSFRAKNFPFRGISAEFPRNAKKIFRSGEFPRNFRDFSVAKRNFFKCIFLYWKLIRNYLW